MHYELAAAKFSWDHPKVYSSASRLTSVTVVKEPYEACADAHAICVLTGGAAGPRVTGLGSPCMIRGLDRPCLGLVLRLGCAVTVSGRQAAASKHSGHCGTYCLPPKHSCDPLLLLLPLPQNGTSSSIWTSRRSTPP